MARPKKNNADYFSHDADMRNDSKIRALRRKYSHTGYAVWSYMLEILTDSDYFEIEWNDLQVELLAGDFDIDPELLQEIVEYCVSTLHLFTLNNGVLFSETLKKRFESVLSKRKREQNGVIDVENPQRKVKESKGKESKVNDISSPPLSPVPGEAVIPETEIPKPKASIPDLDPAPPESPPGSAPPPQGKAKKSKQPPDLSFIESDEMRQIFAEWLEYKAAMGKGYKTEQSVRLCYRKLKRLSDGDPIRAREMIEEAMANNWQSFFEIKRTNNHERSAKNQPPSPNELSRAVAEGVARAHTRQAWE